MGDRRGGYNNGFDRRDDYRGGYQDMPPRGGAGGGYDDRHMHGGGPMGGFEDRRGGISDRKPLMSDPNMGGQRGPMGGYNRNPPGGGGDMYSRRDNAKPIARAPTFEPPQQSTYMNYSTSGQSTPNQGGGYNNGSLNTGGSGGGGYGSYSAPAGNNFNDRSAGGYMEGRQGVGAPGGGGGYSSQGYTSVNAGGGGYGDNYNARGPQGNNNYDSSYPPLPQQRGW